jgi:hypothetical protein
VLACGEWYTVDCMQRPIIHQRDPTGQIMWIFTVFIVVGPFRYSDIQCNYFSITTVPIFFVGCPPEPVIPAGYRVTVTTYLFLCGGQCKLQFNKCVAGNYSSLRYSHILCFIS